MSRYRGSGDFAYREPPPPTRWDADRFARERDYRQVDEYYTPAPPPQRRAARPVYEEERYYYEDDRYGPQGSRVDRRYFEEEDYYDPRAARGQMIPYRPARPPRHEAPPRPGLLRRQSSLDTFDRPPTRRYDDYDTYRPPPRPPRINIDVPEQPGPGSNRYRPAHRARQPPQGYYDDRNHYYSDYYDDVEIQDPEYYGDEGFREYREREWISRRRGESQSRSRSRSRPPTEAPVEEKKEVKEEVKEEKKEIVRKEEIKDEIKEKPYPRKGKTRMPKRLVHTKVLFDLGYQFYEEGEKTIVIEKALGPDNIDEVFSKSREYRESEVSVTKRIEAPPSSAPPPSAPSAPPASVKAPSTVKAPSARAPSVRAPSVAQSVHESIREEERVLKESEVHTVPLSQAPRSVREWDQFTAKEKDRETVRSESRHRSKSRAGTERETVIEIEKERKSTVIEREPSPSPERRRRRRRSKSRRRSTYSEDETEFVERKIIREEEDFGPIIGESDSVHVGPLALVSKGRDVLGEVDIKEKIRILEAEQRALRRERKDRDSEEYIRVERRGPSRDRRREREEEFVRFEDRAPPRDRVYEEEEIVRIEGRAPSRNRGFDREEEIVRFETRGPSRERRRDREEDVWIERRGPSRSPSPAGEILIERRGDEVVEVRKDRRERSISRARAPSAGLIKSMMYAVT